MTKNGPSRGLQNILSGNLLEASGAKFANFSAGKFLIRNNFLYNAQQEHTYVINYV